MRTASDIQITGNVTPTFERLIRNCLDKFPTWFVKAARISKIEVKNTPEIRAQVAMYEHGTRNLYVCPGVGDLLQKAIGHELAHACDDIFEMPHFFSAVPQWQLIHRNQMHFDIPKYQEQPLEYFADMVVKLFMLGPQKLSTTNPQEVMFINSWVFPLLQKHFGQ